MELVGRVKNTFLDFEDEPMGSDWCRDEFKTHTSSSLPVMSRSSSWGSLPETGKARSLQEYRYRNDLVSHVKNEQLECKHEELLEDTMGSNLKTTMRQETTEQRQKHNRPSRNARDRFWQYVEKLKMRLEHDPQNFDCRNIEHPSAFMRDGRSFDKVVSILEKHRAKLLTQHLSTSTSSSSTHLNLACESNSNSNS